MLQEGSARLQYRIHAFCLMTNHVHLLLQVSDIPLSRLMQNLMLRYSTWFNRKHQRIGHLFQGRYKAILIDADAYLLELVRYIHLNPVRARMLKLPDEHPWSGHRALLGKEVLPWYSTDYVLSLFDGELMTASKKYAEFVHDGLHEGTRPEFGCGSHEGRLLGDDSFADDALLRAKEKLPNRVTLDAVISEVCRCYGISESELAAAGKTRSASEARAVAAYVTREIPHLSLTELAQRMRREVSAISQAAREAGREGGSGS
ncbi:helix-turn-helix domain-containing protein [Geotalea toluenoxydans]|uniref:helix-turn-helix domain-containing protein n=1 Tax=Geotalea toluenoxydans TaxID=421624 RepID=UPI001FB229C2|nr:transposase [Geotalea toluenoxydans]